MDSGLSVSSRQVMFFDGERNPGSVFAAAAPEAVVRATAEEPGRAPSSRRRFSHRAPAVPGQWSTRKVTLTTASTSLSREEVSSMP